jgi:hypothetical protein
MIWSPRANSASPPRGLTRTASTRDPVGSFNQLAPAPPRSPQDPAAHPHHSSSPTPRTSSTTPPAAFPLSDHQARADARRAAWHAYTYTRLRLRSPSPPGCPTRTTHSLEPSAGEDSTRTNRGCDHSPPAGTAPPIVTKISRRIIIPLQWCELSHDSFNFHPSRCGLFPRPITLTAASRPHRTVRGGAIRYEEPVGLSRLHIAAWRRFWLNIRLFINSNSRIIASHGLFFLSPTGRRANRTSTDLSQGCTRPGNYFRIL